MNIPYKLTKTGYLSQEKAQSYQKTASKYYKQHQKLKKEFEQSNVNSNTKSKSSKTKIFREEVMKWFFSLDLMTKLIISSIENKWITCILHQLYVNQKYEPRLKYRIKEYDFFNFSNQNSANEYVPSVLKVTINENAYNSLNYSNNDYLEYSNYFCKEDGYYNNYVCLSSMNEVEKIFLDNIIFYRSEEVFSETEGTSKTSMTNVNKYSNYFTLSEKVLQDENLFKSLFAKISNDKAFTDLIDSSYEQTSKYFNICLPNWVNNREFYSLAEIFAAVYEQVISVRYILFKQSQNELSNQRTHLQFVYEEKEELINFMNKNLAMNEVYKALKTDDVVHQLYSDRLIEEFIVGRFHQGDKSHFYMNIHKAHKEFIYDKNKFKREDLKSNVEKFFNSFRSSKDFIYSLTFLPIDKIFSYDDFLFRKLNESLMNLRSQQNAMDLMKELEFEDEYSGLKSERKKSETMCVSNGVHPGTSNSLSGVNNNKVNKKKKKKKVSNSKRSSINITSNINTCNSSTNKTIIEKSETSNITQDKSVTSLIARKSSTIVPSLDLEHIILEIRGDDIEKDSNDIERNLAGADTGTNSVAACSNDAECFTMNSEKKYAFSFIKRTKSNLQQNFTEDPNTVMYKPDPDYIADNAKDIKDKDTNQVKYTSKEFLGSIMFLKQKEEINTENNVVVKDILSEIISIIPTDYNVNNQANNHKIINESNQLISTSPITNKSKLPSVRLDQNDLDTAYSSDGNKSESTESKLLNRVKGKGNKRKKENKFFLYNIKESNLTGYKDKGNTNNRENQTNSSNQIQNQNRKLSQQTGEVSAQKILKQIIDQHFENKKEEEEKAPKENINISDNIVTQETINSEISLEKIKIFSKNLISKDTIISNEANSVIISDEVKSPDNLIEETRREKEIVKISEKIQNFDNSPLNYKTTSNSPKLLSNFIKSNLNREFESKYSNNFIENGHSANYKNNYKKFTNFPPVNPNHKGNNMYYPRTNFNMNFPSLYPYMKPIKPMKAYNTFSNFPSKEYFLPNPALNHAHNHVPFDLFYMKLQRDILEFSTGIDYNLKKLKPIKIATISYLENFIRKFFEKNFEKFSSDIELYGSYASELAIESSDIDITIKIDHKSESERDGGINDTKEINEDIPVIEIMSSLVESFKALGVFEVISPIYTATVPVVKLVLDPVPILDKSIRDKLDEFKQSDQYTNYMFNRDDLDKIRIDLTFSELALAASNTQKAHNITSQATHGSKHDISNHTSSIPSNTPSKIITQLHLDYIRECLITYPELKPVIQILKRFLQSNKLHCSFNGKN